MKIYHILEGANNLIHLQLIQRSSYVQTSSITKGCSYSVG